MNQSKGTGLSDWHRINRLRGVGAICSPGARTRGKIQVAPDEPMQGTGVSGERRIIRLEGVGAMGSPGAWPCGESPVAPDEPTGPSWSVGALTGGLFRTDVK